MTPGEMAAIHALSFSTPRPWNRAEFTALLGAPTAILCTVSRGFLLGRVAGPEAEILTLAVHPEARRQGHARALLTDFEAKARHCGASDAFLEVATDNHAAIALYRLAGYHEAGIRHDYYRSPTGEKVSALVMTCIFSENIKAVSQTR